MSLEEYKTMKKPQVSVVMSVYNAEKYLSQSIDSILNQTFEDFEFIIIEDCSTDNSLTILEDYSMQDSRVKIIRKQENKGMKGFIENLNIGLHRAQGEYIARMDADDISHPTRFEKQVAFLRDNPDVFMVGSSINLIDEENNFIKRLEALERDSLIKRVMPKQISMYHPVIMFRNDFEVRYRENIYYCEDYDLYLRLMYNGSKFYNFAEPLLDYRILNSSISRKDGKFYRTLFLEKMKSFYKERMLEGKDSYEHFNPEYFLNILNEEKKSLKEDLEFGLKVATKFGYNKEFSILKKKYQLDNGFNFNVAIYSLLNSLPWFFTKLYFKLFID
ncbi:glycosyltransferase family 2 protein [Bergeyella zoohelcum]|uniref:glycosyltransferase family 2 protein n=1 Tax=Bergeyella zoohelcum TaxID=1015 RepID=UPI0037352586